MARFVSRPKEVEAIQYTGDNYIEVGEFTCSPDDEPLTEEARQNLIGNPPESITILAGKKGAQGQVPVPVGHWIVRQPGDYTHHWPVDPEYFAKNYIKVSE